MTTVITLSPEDVTVSRSGGIAERDVRHARTVVAHAAAHAAEPVLAARLRLAHHYDPALTQPYTAQVNLDVNGRTVRAQTRAATVGQATAELGDRIRTQLARLARYRDHRPPQAAPDRAEEATGQDTVIYRAGPTGYRLAQLDPEPGWEPSPVVPVSICRRPAAVLALTTAIDHLEATGRPFQFYRAPGGRGHLLYRRHAGGYGLVIPATA